LKQAVQVVILGHEYTIKSDAPIDEVRRVAVFVSERISEAMTAGRIADSLDGAVLALMNVAGAYLRLHNREKGDQDISGRLENMLHRLESADVEPEYSKDNSEIVAETQQGSLYGDF
jgi:cell division protein ZapA (FtsZ GTPase activity inhibitor)